MIPTLPKTGEGWGTQFQVLFTTGKGGAPGRTAMPPGAPPLMFCFFHE